MWGPGEDKDFWEVYWMGRGQGRVPAISHCPDSLGSSEPFTVKTHLGSPLDDKTSAYFVTRQLLGYFGWSDSKFRAFVTKYPKIFIKFVTYRQQ